MRQPNLTELPIHEREIVLYQISQGRAMRKRVFEHLRKEKTRSASAPVQSNQDIHSLFIESLGTS